MIKSLIIAIVFTCLTISSYSQSILDSTKLWHVMECSSGGFLSCHTTIYRIEGDTTFGTLGYKKLLATTDSTLMSWYFAGGLRDSGHKVFYNNSFTEYLIYDFSANVGDTLQSLIGCNPDYFIVDSIDTIQIGGLPRRRLFFDLDCQNEPEQWIEGMGSIHGLINEFLISGFSLFDYGSVLLCYSENGIIEWRDSLYNTCYISTTGINETENLSDVKIFPNPMNSAATVSINNSGRTWNWKLYNYTGETVQILSDITDERIIIERKNLPAGIYYYKVESEKKCLLWENLLSIKPC